MASLISLEKVPSSIGRDADSGRRQGTDEALGRLQVGPVHDQGDSGEKAANTIAAATDEVAYSFRLFAGQTGSSMQRIILTPERDRLAGSGVGEEALLSVRRRPLSYYLRPEATSIQRENFMAAARTAEQIRASAQQRNWGLELPWRVTRVDMSSKDMSQVLRASRRGVQEVNSQPVGQFSSRTRRPGKKSRIRLRAKQKAKLADEKVKVTKEVHLREKKQRLNRQKKLKRRQKARDKKVMPTDHDGKEGSGIENKQI
jgi:hypothetical protein